MASNRAAGLLVLAVLLAAAAARGQRLVRAPSSTVATNAPVFLFTSTVNDSETFAVRLLVSAGDDARPSPSPSPGQPLWDSGWVFLENEPFPGLFVYEGPALTANSSYHWTAMEVQPPTTGQPRQAGSGVFHTSADLPTALDEARAAAAAANVTQLYEGTRDSIVGRVRPSGFSPTSVSGGYGGTANMFVRDSCAMLLAMLRLNETAAAARVLRFMLDAHAQLNLSHPAHVLVADASLSRAVSADQADQTDGAFHLFAAYAQYVLQAQDTALAAEFFPLVQRLVNHYLAPGACTRAGVPYINATNQLLWNPNLEHSRLGHYWSTYDCLTQSMAVGALDGLAAVAELLQHAAQADAWRSVRQELLRGLEQGLQYVSANETLGKPIYAELRGHVHYWWPGGNDSYPPGNTTGAMPLLWGLSFVQQGVVAGFESFFAQQPPQPAAPPPSGLDLARLDSTFDTIRRLGSFLWLAPDPSLSAFVPATHINASTHSDEDRAVIVKGLGWELGYAAARQRWTRVTVLLRWLGNIASENHLAGESYVYDCLRTGGSCASCCGDVGNGEQAGWLVWGLALVRKTLGLYL